MQNTTNYNLLIAEGTDVVNPLTQIFPNFTTIDGAMFANKQGSIGTATEVTTGTVHAITRNNTDSDVFRFTATSAWTTGDTMTLDGNSVTVHLTDGTAPLTGAYIIGSEVLAVVTGALVTLIMSNAIVDPGVTSFNSRTGAVSPAASDYDASMIDYDNTSSGLVATDVQSAVDELAASTHGFFELWLNPAPTATFGPQTVSFMSNLSLDAVYIESGSTGGSDTAGLMLGLGRGGSISQFGITASGGIDQFSRTVSLASIPGGYAITFSDCNVRSRSNAGVVSDSVINTAIVPYRILGLVHND